MEPKTQPSEESAVTDTALAQVNSGVGSLTSCSPPKDTDMDMGLGPPMPTSERAGAGAGASDKVFEWHVASQQLPHNSSQSPQAQPALLRTHTSTSTHSQPSPRVDGTVNPTAVSPSHAPKIPTPVKPLHGHVSQLPGPAKPVGSVPPPGSSVGSSRSTVSHYSRGGVPGRGNQKARPSFYTKSISTQGSSSATSTVVDYRAAGPAQPLEVPPKAPFGHPAAGRDAAPPQLRAPLPVDLPRSGTTLFRSASPAGRASSVASVPSYASYASSSTGFPLPGQG